MASSSQFLTSVALLFASLTLAVSAKGMAETSEQECIDLTGVWRSGAYEALSVWSTGESSEIAGLEMVLVIDFQHGCHFYGINHWSNGQIGGEEPLIGVLNPVGNWITMIESEPHPDGGSTGRIFGRVTDENHINWEYAAYSTDGQRMNVFSTVLSRGRLPVAEEDCPDLTGTWEAQPYDTIETNPSGGVTIKRGKQAVLTIQRQHACHIDGHVVWKGYGGGFVERIVGALHNDGKLITILGHGDPSETATQAYVHAEVLGPDNLHWDFVGLSHDEAFARAFSTTFTRAGTSAERDVCPSLLGTWESSAWEGLEAHETGRLEQVTREFKVISIEGQHGCMVWGETIYGPRAGEERGHTDQVVGVINGKDSLLITRNVAPHRQDGYAAVALSRIQARDRMITEYSGEIVRNGATFVYLTELNRK